MGIQNLPADRATGTGRQAAGAAAVGDRAQQRLVIGNAGRADEGEQARAVVVAAANAGNCGVSQLVAAQPAAGDAHLGLAQLGVIRIAEAQGRGKGDGSSRLGKACTRAAEGDNWGVCRWCDRDVNPGLVTSGPATGSAATIAVGISY